MFRIYSKKNDMYFNVRLVNFGDSYGKDDCLVHMENKPMIEFYDPRYFPENGRGQFISRYYLKTLIEDQEELFEFGLDLQGDAPSWKVDGEAVKAALQCVVAEHEYEKWYEEQASLDEVAQLEKKWVSLCGKIVALLEVAHVVPGTMKLTSLDGKTFHLTCPANKANKAAVEIDRLIRLCGGQRYAWVFKEGDKEVSCSFRLDNIQEA